MNRVKLLLKLADTFRRALDYQKDPNPEHWKTAHGAHIHIDENGNCDGGAGGALNGKNENGYRNNVPELATPGILIEELPRRNGRRRFESKGRRYTQIKLPYDEYARVMSEIDTWMTKERIQKGIYWQHIRDYAYVIIIVDVVTNDIVIVGKKRIP